MVIGLMEVLYCLELDEEDEFFFEEDYDDS